MKYNKNERIPQENLAKFSLTNNSYFNIKKNAQDTNFLIEKFNNNKNLHVLK